MTQELLTQVKQYALDHYTDGGWDVVVETYTDAELAEEIAGCTTLDEVLAHFEPVIDVWSDRQAFARNEKKAAG